jgi:DNA-binding winged helix-turn-helix (wHTH) protein
MVNIFNRYAKNLDLSKSTYKDSAILNKEGLEILLVRNENSIFELISDETMEGFVIPSSLSFTKKFIDFLKRKTLYVPILIYGDIDGLVNISGADIYIPFAPSDDKEFSYQVLFDIIIRNVSTYSKNFGKLKKLMTKMAETIDFDACKYDPTRRMLSYKGKDVKKLSAKEGGILEILCSNFGQVVKREIILEKVWRKDDYFSGRSMDVYVTHLRRLFQEHNIKLTIKNISGVGLILE